MKKLYLFFALLLSLTGMGNAMALELPTGLFDLGEAATTLETGKWYFLYNQGTGKFIQENASNALKQVTSPKGKEISANAGYLVTLEEAADGKYYIKTGLGNYYKGPSTSARGTGATVTTSWAMTIAAIESTTGHFTLQGTTYYMNAPADGSDIKGGTTKTAGSIGDWVFYNVGTTSPDQLTGRDLYNYQMSKLGLIRLHNKRTATAYLTANTSGTAVGAGKVASGLSQIWIIEKSGAGYTVRSANTGQFLQSTFGTPTNSATVLYVQFSPNNTGTQSYINISSASDFSGQTCLNLGNNGTTVTKWSYSNDAGSDWAIELVEDVTEEEVLNHMNAAKGYAGELKNGAYYRLISTAYDRYATEVDGNNVQSIQLNTENYSQYWKLVKNGTGWAFQNVVSQRYIQIQGTTSATYKTGTAKATLYPSRTSDKWEYKWVIANGASDGMGMHTASSQSYNVVRWSVSADASIWAFQEVELTDEEIEAARGSQQEYANLVNNIPTYQAHLNALFEDYACTTLKSSIQSLTDEQLAANADYAALNKDMQQMVLKVKNNTWQSFTNKTTGYSADYEKFFRIADYQIYSNYQDMSNGSNFTMSNAFGRLSGPTGIVANGGQIVYIYVDADAKSECTLALETVTTDGVSGNHPTGTQTALKKGLNVYMASQQVLLYIFHQLNNTQKYLADYPDIKIHIEGGELNGYWDATRGMTDADWALLQQDLLKAPFVNLKTKHLVFQMDTELVTAAEPKNMEGLMRIWEMIPTNEDRYMGVEDFEGRYNNIWNAFSGASSYMHSTTYGTWYTESTIPTVMNYNKMRQGGNIWGPSHEIGHNHQGSINVIGTTESSNNLFSNINRFEQGIQTSRRQLPCDVFYELAKGTPWLGRNIWNTTSMFFQLYLYFHAQHHDDQFYPNLFRTMRKNPINKGTWDGSVTFTKADGTSATGARVAKGSLDYLHLAKMICDVAQADLSEFFEAYGMFVPVNKYYVGDYADYLVTTTQTEIDAAKKYMQKYPKKLGNIMFIDDHVLPMKAADPDNKFEGQVPANGKKTNDTSQHDELGNGQKVGDVGDYESYDGHEEYDVDGDYFTISGNTISFKGSGYVGHKFYDKDGNLIWATSAKSETLPSQIRTLGVDNYTVVAAQANMEDVPCPYYKSGTSKVYKALIYFGNEEGSKQWWANASTQLAQYLPENAIGVVGTADPTENITSAPNIINEGTAKSIVLNGDKPAYIPEAVTAASVTFKKTIDGYAALDLPFDVTSSDIAGLQTATYENDVLSVTAATSVEAGKPVVVNGNVDVTLTNATLKQGTHQRLTAVKVLASDGQSVEEVEEASPFTFNLGEATGIRSIDNGRGTTDHVIYDLSGRRIERITKAGLYIIDGKKSIVK